SDTCARCHTGEGPGTPHVRMDTAEDVRDNAFAIAGVVDLGVMPPWPATEHSVAFADDWSLSEEERAAITRWHAEGAPLDVDPNDEIVATAGVFALTDHDLEVAPVAGYDGEAGQPDEYRCLVYDPQITGRRHLEAFEFVPDQAAVVHHAIGYVVRAPLMNVAQSFDGQDGQPGWSCFGSSGLGEDEIFLGWAPGQGPTELPEGSGMPMEAGDFIVIQIHYHFDIDAPADLSSVRLRWSESGDPDDVIVTSYVAPAEIPCSPEESGPLCDRDAAIADAVTKYGQEGVLGPFITQSCGYAPDDFVLVGGVVSGSCDSPIGVTGQVVSVLGHEHELGKTFRMTLHPDTPDERVLLDIDSWDFDWQLNYYPVEEIQVAAEDWVRIECSWDRSLRDPVLEPAYVVWADGTDDEMCFATIAIREAR
ncbi:MAG: YceI family protein, partial [Acidimicrobiales bacterium]